MSCVPLLQLPTIEQIDTSSVVGLYLETEPGNRLIEMFQRADSLNVEDIYCLYGRVLATDTVGFDIRIERASRANIVSTDSMGLRRADNDCIRDRSFIGMAHTHLRINGQLHPAPSDIDITSFWLGREEMLMIVVYDVVLLDNGQMGMRIIFRLKHGIMKLWNWRAEDE